MGCAVTITLRDIERDVDELAITLAHDGDSWSATAETDLLGTLGGFPSETVEDALQDVGWSIARESARVVFAQLTHYQVAVVLTSRVERIGGYEWTGKLADAHVTANDTLDAIGITELSHRHDSWMLTDDGRRTLLVVLAEWTEMTTHPKVQAAVKRLTDGGAL